MNEDQSDLWTVDLKTGARKRLPLGIPWRLFSMPSFGTNAGYQGFAVRGDGQRFLTLQSEPEASIQRVVVVLDFKPAK